MTNSEKLQKMLARHRGKFGSVEFVKKNGDRRTMNFRQGVKNGTTPLKEGTWSNSDAKASDYDLVLVTDVSLEKEGEHSRRSFKLSSVKSLKIGGEVFTT